MTPGLIVPPAHECSSVYLPHMGISQTTCRILMANTRYATIDGILKGGASMLVGYARVSTTEPHLDLQRDALTQAGWGHVFTDTASGARAECPSVAQTLHYLREGDVLAVWKLDRLGRSLKDLIEMVTALEQ